MKHSYSASYNNIKWALHRETNPVGSGRGGKIKMDTFPSGHNKTHFKYSCHREALSRGASASLNLWPTRRVKLYGAEDNFHIACSSTRVGMSLARGHCQERPELPTCHGSCTRSAWKSLPRQSAFLSIGRGKSRRYYLLLQSSNALSLKWGLDDSRWRDATVCELDHVNYSNNVHLASLLTFGPWRFVDTLLCIDGCVKQEQL